MAARCWARVSRKGRRVRAQKANSTAAARPNRQTIDTTASTGPSCRVMAYQVVPQIRAQAAMAKMAKGRLKLDLPADAASLITPMRRPPLTSCARV